MVYCLQNEEKLHFGKEKHTMRIFTSAISMSESEAMFQYQEHSYFELRSYRDKLKRFVGVTAR